MKVRVLGLIAVSAAMALSIVGCQAPQQAEEKNIPEGMSETAYDMGTEVYEISGNYISGVDGYDTTAAGVMSAITESANEIDIEGNDKDERVFMMCSVINAYLSTGEEDKNSKGNVENYRDGLGYTLQTGEYSEDFKSLEEVLVQ